MTTSTRQSAAELTNTVFTPDPHRPHQRRYKTGDLVRRDHNGTYYHLGRTDSQIKLRGHRIELGEIEATLNNHPHITHTVVTTYTLAVGDTLFTRGSSTIVWLDGTTGRPKSLPDGVRAMVSEGTVDV